MCVGMPSVVFMQHGGGGGGGDIMAVRMGWELFDFIA